MLFVFAAMAEFAFVLFVTQKEAWKNVDGDYGSNGTKTNKIPRCRVTKVPNLETKRAGRLQQINDQETRTVGFGHLKNDRLHGLPLTTKIDFAAFVIYCSGYLVFNFVYCLRLLD